MYSDDYLGILAIIVLIALVVMIFFCLTQQNTLKAIQPQNRTMSPGEVWLQFIPLFNLVWQFVVVTRIADSIKKEFEFRQQHAFLGLADPEIAQELGKRPTYSVGMAFCILSIAGVIPMLGVIAALAGFVCRIVYWVQLAGYKSKLERLAQHVDTSTPPSL
jgi:hypothetical protein